MNRPRRLALLLVSLYGVLVAAGIVLVARWPHSAGPGYLLATALLAAPAVGLGLLVATRRPGSPIGPLLILLGVVPLLIMVGDAYDAVGAAHPGSLPVPDLEVSLSQGSWMLLYLPAAYLLLLFPDGRLPARRWRVVAVGLLAVPLAFIPIAAMSPDPYAPPFQDRPHVLGVAPAPVRALGVALLPVFLGLLVASAVAPVRRYRGSADPVRRAQLKWFALGALALPATLLLCWLSYLLLDGPDLVLLGFATTLVAVPAATAVALLRHDLYDVDRAVSEAVAYGLATTALLGVFTVLEGLGGALLGRDSAVVAALGTAVCVAALVPVRRRLQAAVDRRLYPMRRAALDAVDDLRRRVHAGRARPEDLQDVLREALRDPGLRVGYLAPGADSPTTADGGRLDGAGAVPVELGGVRVGALLPSATPASRELLREVAAAGALIVEVVRVRLEVGKALREVNDSRSRLLRIGYEERRRLERDLHDGAQQRLVSLGVALRLAQRHLGDGSVDVDGLLDQAVAELGTAVAELRAIAHGLRPASLDQGLVPALHTLASSVPIAVDVELCPDAIPDDVATTAYYVASEALTNAVKHAAARRIALSVSRRDATLYVRVSDDGRGGAAPRPGSGLAGLLDRVAAADGRLALDSPDGRGTVVEAMLPCAS